MRDHITVSCYGVRSKSASTRNTVQQSPEFLRRNNNVQGLHLQRGHYLGHDYLLQWGSGDLKADPGQIACWAFCLEFQRFAMVCCHDTCTAVCNLT